MIKLKNKPLWRGGGLWFKIPKELQPLIPSYLSTKLADVKDIDSLLEYVTQLSPKRPPETSTIWAEGKYGEFVFYAIDDEWRCGDRNGISVGWMQAARQEVIDDIVNFGYSLQIRSIPGN